MLQILKLKLLLPCPWHLSGKPPQGVIVRTHCLLAPKKPASSRPGKACLANLRLPQLPSQPSRESNSIFRLLPWVSTFKSMPSSLKLEDHFFSLTRHLDMKTTKQAWNQQASYRTERSSLGFTSILTLKSKHSLPPGYPAETWFHNSMFSLLCAKLYPDDVFPCHCAQRAVRQQRL